MAIHGMIWWPIEYLSHAIGTGSHDLSAEIGAITTIMALEALDKDAQTEVITIIAKPPDGKVLEHLLARTKSITKPVIGCFFGDGRSA